VRYPTLSGVGVGGSDVKGRLARAGPTSRDVCRVLFRRPFLNDVGVFYNRR